MTQLDRDFQALTGLRYNVSQLVEGASTAEEKQKVYDYISWNIKNIIIKAITIPNKMFANIFILNYKINKKVETKALP